MLTFSEEFISHVKNRVYGEWGIPNFTPEEILENFNSNKSSPIGSGACGEVRQVGAFAVKHITANKGAAIPDREINILHQIDSPFSVKYFGAFKAYQYPYLVMEFVDSGDLEGVMKKLQECGMEGVPEKPLAQMVCQILLLLNYLKKINVMHRDLKPANCFINNQGLIKVGDYGLSKKLPDGQISTQTITGTPRYNSPERLKEENYDFSVDIWSLGIIVAELFCGFYPLNDKYIKNIFAVDTYLSQIKEEFEKSFKNLNIQPSNELRDFVTKCCKYVPEERATAEELLNHPFITLNNDMDSIKPLISCMDWKDVEIPKMKELIDFLADIESEEYYAQAEVEPEN